MFAFWHFSLHFETIMISLSFSASASEKFPFDQKSFVYDHSSLFYHKTQRDTFQTFTIDIYTFVGIVMQYLISQAVRSHTKKKCA